MPCSFGLDFFHQLFLLIYSFLLHFSSTSKLVSTPFPYIVHPITDWMLKEQAVHFLDAWQFVPSGSQLSSYHL
uniref:Uncharacterized protein n=1 Tax=Arundo donax TaxID=35708 RepID=A0A0A8ZCG5_ARUDO